MSKHVNPLTLWRIPKQETVVTDTVTFNGWLITQVQRGGAVPQNRCRDGGSCPLSNLFGGHDRKCPVVHQYFCTELITCELRIIKPKFVYVAYLFYYVSILPTNVI